MSGHCYRLQLIDKYLKNNNYFVVMSYHRKTHMNKPKVTIDEDEFVRLKYSDLISSGISSEVLRLGEI